MSTYNANFNKTVFDLKNKQERDNARSLKLQMDRFEFILFIVTWERMLKAINSTSNELQSPKCDLSAASRLLNCSISELHILRRSWDSALLTATALAEPWSSSLHFQEKRSRRTRRAVDELSFDDRLTDPEKAFRAHVFYKTVDTAFMQLTERFDGQNMVTSTFNILYPQRMSK